MRENNEENICEFSRVIKLDEIKEENTDLTFKASKGECNALASRFNINQIANFNSTIGTRRIGEGIYEIKGVIEAELIIVISETENHEEYILSDSFYEVFASQSSWEDINNLDPNSEFHLELVTEGSIDIGEVIAQNFCLALDSIITQAGRLDDRVKDSLTYGDQFEVKDSPFSILLDKNFDLK